MARFTTAYSAFTTRLGEVEVLRRFGANKEKINAVGLRHEINAFCRGAIVLLSGYLEAFIRDLGEVALESMHEKQIPRGKLCSRMYYHISKDILDEVQDTSDPEKIGEKIFSFIESDLTFWSRVGAFPEPVPVERFCRGFSNPSYKKISSYLNRFGYNCYKKDLGSMLKAKYKPTINMVDHLVDTRNKIAHGDPAATKTPSEVRDMMLLIRSYCRATDSCFAGWWKANYCSIR